MAKVVHLTTVHPPFDNRIFHRECKSLAAAGYDVTLIATHDKEEVIEGVRVLPLNRQNGRLRRMILGAWQCYRLAVSEDADLYHFHDPELLLVGLLLRLRRKPVIYDVHEDYVTSIRQKGAWPKWFGRLLALLASIMEPVLALPCTVVLAERYYKRRFSRGTTVLNYPDLSVFPVSFPQSGLSVGKRLIYTGTVMVDRGALNHARLCQALPDFNIDIIGRCPESLAQKMRLQAGTGAERLHFTGINEAMVPFEQILSAYKTGNYLAGLAIFPQTEHYTEKELTKFFEYMSAGLPIVCSDFPTWKKLVADNDAGICVSPDDVPAQVAAIRKLADDPALARRMGKNGRRAVESTYNWANEARKLLDLYTELLQSRNIYGPSNVQKDLV